MFVLSRLLTLVSTYTIIAIVQLSYFYYAGDTQHGLFNITRPTGT